MRLPAKIQWCVALGPAIGLLLLLAVFPSAAKADRDCSDFATQADAQHYFVSIGGPSQDPDGLDADHDGIACESNPCPCDYGTGGGAPLPPPSSAPPPQAKRFQATLDRVVDGDTLRVFIGRRHPYVRLIGIDTPEVFGTAECGGPQASSALKRRIRPGAPLRLVTDPTQDRYDQYGRLLAYAIKRANGLDLNDSQIAGGWARVYVFDQPFRRLPGYQVDENNARTNGLGVWGLCGEFAS